MKRCFYPMFIALIASINCMAQTGVSISTANCNDHIDAKSRSEIKLLDDKIIAAFNENDPHLLISLYSERLQKDAAGKSEEFINTVHPVITSKNYALLDEYLYKSSAIGNVGTVFKGQSEDNDYSINFNIYSTETYISLLLYKGPINEFLFTVIYGKYADSWKIDVIRVGPYKVLGKDAVDFYKLAENYLAKGDLIDAGINLRLTQQLCLPAEQIFVYFKFPEMKEFGTKLAQEGEAKISFPLKISQISSTPQVFDLEPVVLKEGVFPSIKYLSTIRLEDTTALRKENDQIKGVIGKIFPGIDRDNKYIFFKAYNQMPDGKTPVHTYGFMLKKGDESK